MQNVQPVSDRCAAGWWSYEFYSMAGIMREALESPVWFALHVPTRVYRQVGEFFLEMEHSIARKPIAPTGAHLLALRALGACSADGDWFELITRDEADAKLQRLSVSFKSIESRLWTYSPEEMAELNDLFDFFHQLYCIEEDDRPESFYGVFAPSHYAVVH